jgi:hypothetical protein
MVIRPTDIQLRKSANTVSGITSLGGAITSTLITQSTGSIWDEITGPELTGSVVGEYEVRCVYAININPSRETLLGVQVYIQQNTVSPYTDIDIGLGSSGIGQVEQTVANENTIPVGVRFSFARGEENALVIGDIPYGSYCPIWIRRHAGPAPVNASTPGDNYELKFKIRLTPGPVAPPGVPPVPPPTIPPPGTPPSPPNPPTPPPPGTPPTPPPPPPSANDQFGVRIIYPDAPSSAFVSPPFYLPATSPQSDCRFDPDTPLTANSDGSFRVSNPSSMRMRIYITEPTGCAKTVIGNAVNNLDTYDHSLWDSRGYIYSQHDWRAVEITVYIRIDNAGSVSAGGESINFKVRGVRFASSVSSGCGGPGYISRIYDDGRFAWTKQQFFNSSVSCGDSNTTTKIDAGVGSLRGKWFGYKMMVWSYTSPTTGAVNVHMESWLDPSGNNTWQKISEKEDIGGWYAGMPSTSCNGDQWCGGSRDQIIKWGSPICHLFWDNYSDVSFKWLSVREITPPSGTSPPPIPPPGTPPTPPPPLPPPSPDCPPLPGL